MRSIAKARNMIAHKPGKVREACNRRERQHRRKIRAMLHKGDFDSADLRKGPSTAAWDVW